MYSFSVGSGVLRECSPGEAGSGEGEAWSDVTGDTIPAVGEKAASFLGSGLYDEVLSGSSVGFFSS